MVDMESTHITFKAKFRKSVVNYNFNFQTGHYLHVQKYLSLVLNILSCVFRIKLFFEVFVSFASEFYNFDTGIKDPHFSLKLKNSAP